VPTCAALSWDARADRRARCELRSGSDWLGGLAVYIADIGVDFEVLEPLEFADRVRVRAERFTRAADRAGSAP
jgi:hypothetical protein